VMSHLIEPWEGRVGDQKMYMESDLRVRPRTMNTRSENTVYAPNERLYIYGDPAYGLSYGILSPFKSMSGSPLDTIQQAKNTAIVEHGFGKAMMLWDLNRFKYNLQIGLSPVAAYFMPAVLFTNNHTRFNGSQTILQFHCSPATVDEYL
ncbi:hypothetical protein BZA77DRAFT_227491, partial [Pyronema omphalodes]